MSIPSVRIRSATCGSLEAHNAVPVIDQRLEFLGDSIRYPHVAVADDLGLPAIVMGKKRQQRLPDGVIAEVGREESDPQPAVGRGVVRVRADPGGERLGVLPGPEAMRGQERLGVVIGMKMQGIEKVARRHQEIGLELEGLAEMGQCFLVAPLILEHVAQGVIRLGIIGPSSMARPRAAIASSSRP